jgi:hypothetical protein
MPALVAGIHVFLQCCKQDVDGRDKPGHDDRKNIVPVIVYCGSILASFDSSSHFLISWGRNSASALEPPG